MRYLRQVIYCGNLKKVMLDGKPLVVELFCGCFGWSAGWLERGGIAVGFDLVHESYHGTVPEGAMLVLQDVRTLHGSQFRDADLILASPPCQAYSYMAMPWSRAKAMAARYRENVGDLNALFNACFRIQLEACQAAGRHIPLVIENVKGAQPWVGPAKAHFGSFYLWGEVESVGGHVVVRPEFGHGIAAGRRRKVDGFNFHQFEETGNRAGCSIGSGQTVAAKPSRMTAAHGSAWRTTPNRARGGIR